MLAKDTKQASNALRDFVLRYATEPKREVNAYLKSLSISELSDLLGAFATHYFNDKNSSAMREMATVWLAGYEYNYEKLGYNGYRQDVRGETIKCEVKPQNSINTKRKLNGGGSFNDYTPKRFEKDNSENPDMLFSGFVQGRLMFILRTQFRHIAPQLKAQLDKRFGDSTEVETGNYLRSATVSFSHYADTNPKIIYTAGSELEKNRDNFQRKLYDFLVSNIHEQ